MAARLKEAAIASILVIQHTSVCPPARAGRWLTVAGCTLDVRRCHVGEPLPTDLAGHDGLLVLGGEMGAYDDERFAWLGPTKDLLSEAVRRDFPTLAICLGAQLLAVAEGGCVTAALDGPQIGLQPVRLSPAAAEDSLFAPLDATSLAVHWNNDLVTMLPTGAVTLSTTDAGVQSYRLGDRVWAVQFHPEVDVTILRRWAKADVAAGLFGTDWAEQRLAAVAAADAQLVAAWRGLTKRFAAAVQTTTSLSGAGLRS